MAQAKVDIAEEAQAKVAVAKGVAKVRVAEAEAAQARVVVVAEVAGKRTGNSMWCCLRFQHCKLSQFCALSLFQDRNP